MNNIFKTNIKSIIDFYHKQTKLIKKNKDDIINTKIKQTKKNIELNNKILLQNDEQQSLLDKQIFKHYDPVPGYIYCMKNIIFNYYGDNVFKIGNSVKAREIKKYLIENTNKYNNILKKLVDKCNIIGDNNM